MNLSQEEKSIRNLPQENIWHIQITRFLIIEYETYVDLL